MSSLVKLAKSGFYNLLRTGIESFPREATGHLYGERIGRSLVIHNSYPLQTATRKPTEVFYGNCAAVKRLKRLDEATGNYLVGGFHSHIKCENDEKPLLRLSKSDISFIEDDMKAFGFSSWLEIVLRLKTLDYSNPKPLCLELSEQKKKLNVTIADTLNHSYQAVLCAYLLLRVKGKTRIKELKIRGR